MANKKNSQTDVIDDLEKINQVIDFCIDRELYEELKKIVHLNEAAKNFLQELPGGNGKKPFSTDLNEFPVTKITLPVHFAKYLSLKSRSITFQKEGDRFLKYWSCLFWVKRIRAEILQNNNADDWIKLYEELILLLENNIPASKDQDKFDDGLNLNLTRFNYLMELSAVATSELSYGYAERARHLLADIFPHKNNSKNVEKRMPYDRWIWWNMGMAYQHMGGRNQKAILEFNRVIRSFFDNALTLQDKKDVVVRDSSNSLEFLLNILPATLQRAAIHLKQQLGYHALQALFDSGLFLDEISKKFRFGIYSKAIPNLRKRLALFRLDAFQQLGTTEEVEKSLKDVYETIFLRDEWDCNEPSLKPFVSDPPSADQTQLVEQIAAWFLGKTTGTGSCGELINKLSREKDNKELEKIVREIVKEVNLFCKGIGIVTEIYWNWIENNSFDKRIYFSRWAQFLKRGTSILFKLNKNKEFASCDIDNWNVCTETLLQSIINLYCKHRQKLPVIRQDRPVPNETLELEKFRSDDLPDFAGGLSSFYEKISIVLLEKNKDFSNLKTKAENILNEKEDFEKDQEPINVLKKDHLRLLAALDEYHKEFGENQQIHALKRCNERLIWHKVDPEPKGGCSDCFKGENNSSKPSSFDGLLSCQEDIPRDEKLLPYKKRNRFDLLCYNYESIMQETEEHLTKHLERHSWQEPPRAALHFLGLQRWNSLTPAQGRSVGGGYFVYRTNDEGEVDLGIAIDPGFDYVRNLFRMGFSLRDVDIVLISHAHADHLWDFESMVQLLNELEEKKSIVHQLNVVLTLGSYQRLEHIINNPKLRRFINPLVIDIRKEIEPGFLSNLGPGNNTPEEFFNYCFAFTNKKDKERWAPILPDINANVGDGEIEIWPTRAYHDDFSISDSFGFIIKIKPSENTCINGEEFCFGYTGDTKWVGNDLYHKDCCPGATIDADCKVKYIDQPRWKDVAGQYRDCNVLLMHIGSLIDHKDKDKQQFKNYQKRECEKLIRDKNHPYLMGMIRFLGELYKNPSKDKLILMGEFGEELRGGIRIDLVKRFQQWLGSRRILPVDVGLDVLLYDCKVSKGMEDNSQNIQYEFLCALCDKHRPLTEIDYLRFGPDEAIFYTCKTCKKAIPSDVRDTRLRQLYDIGRELRTLPQSN